MVPGRGRGHPLGEYCGPVPAVKGAFGVGFADGLRPPWTAVPAPNAWLAIGWPRQAGVRRGVQAGGRVSRVPKRGLSEPGRVALGSRFMPAGQVFWAARVRASR